MPEHTPHAAADIGQERIEIHGSDLAGEARKHVVRHRDSASQLIAASSPVDSP